MTETTEITKKFEEMDLSSHEPAWSSHVLESLFEAGGEENRRAMTILRGFDISLKRSGARLTETVAHLVRDVTLLAFTKDREIYERDFGWVNEVIRQEQPSPTRCYLFLRILPPTQAEPTSLLSILRGLEGTPQMEEALETLSEDFDQPEVQQGLSDWKSNGMSERMAEKIAQYLSSGKV